MTTLIRVDIINNRSDLTKLTSQINNAQWDEANDIEEYRANSLVEFVSDKNNIMAIAYWDNQFAGLAFGTILTKAYDDNFKWLYVDEVDVTTNHRRKGVGKALMQKMLTIKEERECQELWLATEADNIPAQKLYESLSPKEIEDVKGYLF